MAVHSGFHQFRGAFLWVSTFFTLSGFLITTLLIEERDRHGSISLTGFWARRMRRLLPAALLTLAGVAAYGATLADAGQVGRLRGDGLAALGYVANWRFVFSGTRYEDLFASPSPVQHFWTLSIEEQFYAVFPLVVVLVTWASRGSWRVFGAAMALVSAASVCWSAFLSASGARLDRMYFGTDTRLAEIAAGALLAVLVRERRVRVRRAGGTLRYVGPAVLVVAVVATFVVDRTDPRLYMGGLALWSIVSCLLVLAAADDTSPVGRVLSAGPLRTTGVLSYGAYLFHWPLFLVLSEERTGLEGVPLFVLRLGATLLAAAISYRFLEEPIRRGRKLSAHRARVVLPLVAASVAVAFFFVTSGRGRLPNDFGGVAIGEMKRPPLEAGSFVTPPSGASRRPASVGAGEGESAALDDGEGVPESAPNYVDPLRVVVVGDSQAWVLAKALERASRGTGGHLVVWNAARPGCGLVRGGFVKRPEGSIADPCGDWEPELASGLSSFRPQLAVVQSGMWDWIPRRLEHWKGWREPGDEEFDRHVEAEYGLVAGVLSASGARVVWLTNPCYELEGFGTDPVWINRRYLRPLERRGAVVLHDLHADLCPGGEFSQKVGPFETARPDGMHLSDEAADWFVRQLLPSVLSVARLRTHPSAYLGGGASPGR